MTFPIVLEGNSLGKRHKQLNALTNEVIASKLPLEQIKDVAETRDVERLLKIDVASAQRNVDYILYNLQSDDMLYVSRALRSTWLIKDPQYTHIMNPQYLHNQLFPLMINRAICKLKLTIRLHLKDENRCEEFFKYYYDNNDKRQALMFLPLCPEKFIIDKLNLKELKIPNHMIKRFCEKVPSISQDVFKSLDHYNTINYLDKLRFLTKTNTEIYLDLLEQNLEVYRYNHLKLGKRSTRTIMQLQEERVFQKPELYMRVLHLPTIAEVLGPIKAKEFVIKLSNNPKMDQWFSYKAVRPLLNNIKYNEKYELLKAVFEEREKNKKNRELILIQDAAMAPPCLMESFSFTSKKMKMSRSGAKASSFASMSMLGRSARQGTSISNVYEWYRYAPFPVAFAKLKKLIRTEAQPEERLAMLKILVQSTNKNLNFLQQLLQYFIDRHINEPTNFREQFVRNLLQSTQAYRYEDSCWKILDELFHNLGVYEEGGAQIEGCIEAIMLYHILRDQPVPDTVLDKWHKDFSNMQSAVKKLKSEERDKVFGALSSWVKIQLSQLPLENADDLNKVIKLSHNLLDLLEVWKQPLSEQSDLLELLKKVIDRAQAFSLLESVNYYGRNKKWNRLLFSEALLMRQTQDVLINTLKHNTNLLKKHEVQLQHALEADNTNLDRFLSKLRIYFHNDLAIECVEKLKGRLEEMHGKRVARAICILMHRDSFSELLKKYVPQNQKIKWSEESMAKLNARKFLARQMFLVRPLANVTDLVAFAKGDYMQYVLPSLRSVCFQLPLARCQVLLPELLSKSVSVQKHAIRLAFAKLSAKELQTLFIELWERANNASIRALLYKLTFEMLCRQETDDQICEVWNIMKMLTSKLTTDEDRSIYATLGNTNNIPKKVLPEFCAMSYRYLKTVPEKMNCERHINSIYDAMSDIVDELDEGFVYEILNGFLKSAYVEKGIFKDGKSYNSNLWNIFHKFLLCCETESEQLGRYEQIGKLFVKYTKDLWHTRKDMRYEARTNCVNFAERLSIQVKNTILVKDRKYVTPIALFESFCRDMEEFNNYFSININLHLMIAVLEAFDSLVTERASSLPDKQEEFDDFLLKELSPRFGVKCGALLDQYLSTLYPSFLSIFVGIVTNFVQQYLDYSSYGKNALFIILMVESLISDLDNVYNVLLGVYVFPNYNVCSEVKEEFVRVYKKLQAIENKEVQAHLITRMPFNEKLD